MSSRTTVTLEDDVVEKLKKESRARGIPFRTLLNDLLRLALATKTPAPRRNFKVKPFHTGGLMPGINLDCTGALLEYLEGPEHR